MHENRAIKRFVIQLPVGISTDNAFVEDACTKDISANGAFILTSNPLEKGTCLDLQVMMPSKAENKKRGHNTLMVQGKVIRTDADGMAVQFFSKGIINPY